MKIKLKDKFLKFASDNGYLFAAFSISLLIMFMIYIALEVFPFGKNSVLVLDLNGQYVYFFEELKAKLLNGGSLLYTWSRTLGGEFMGIFAYYLASPFSFLTVLFSNKYMLECLFMIILLKTGCMGATMAYYLNKTRPTKKLNIIIFSICYALSSYAVVMAHNTMWIDNLILLPLITLGIENLIKKREFKLFVISLSMSILTNFYIGYMMCIYVALYYFYYYFSHNQHSENNLIREDNHFVRSLGRIILYSLMAVAIAAIIILPTYTSLQFGKNTFSDPNFDPTVKFDILDFVSKLFPSSYDTVRPEGLPFVYCGVAVLILFFLYFITPRIKWQERVMSALIVIVFFFSFSINTLDMVWHGFQRPNWLNYRYSFMFIFLMILFAYKAFEHIRFADYRHVVFISGILIVLLAVIQKQHYEWFDKKYALAISILLIAVFTVALYFEHSQKFKTGSTIAVCVLVCIEMFSCGLLNAVGLDEDVHMSSRSSYNAFMNAVRPDIKFIEQYDTSEFYRMEKTFHRKTNDPMTLGYYGITGSTSTLNKNVISVLNKLGYTSRSHWSQYTGGTSVADSLIGLKYIISDYEIEDRLFNQINYVEKTKHYIYENPYALSLAFASSSEIKDFVISDYDSPFVVSNKLVSALIGEETDIFHKLTVSDKKYHNIKTGFTSNHRVYSKADESLVSEIDYTVEVKAGVPVYMCIPTEYPRECSLRVNGEDFGIFLGTDGTSVKYIGTFESDTEIKVTLRMNKPKLYIMNNQDFFFYIDNDAFADAFNKLSEGNMTITEFRDDYISGTVNVPENCSVLYTSIPYDEGWKVTVDGEEMPIIRTSDAFLSVDIAPGRHNIEMTYLPKCYTQGLWISRIGFVSFIIAIAYDEFRKRRELRKWAEENYIF